MQVDLHNGCKTVVVVSQIKQNKLCKNALLLY